jgi:HPt (histidine-containing phosphotransfer) domain-containing protein
VPVDDPELTRLLILELERHRAVIHERGEDLLTVQRSLHALKGSAALAGERELAATLERLQRRLHEQDGSATDEAALVVKRAIEALRAGETAVATQWPEPPDDLVSRPIEPLVRAQYNVEVSERLTRIDDALASQDDPVDVLAAIYRHLNTMKGAASAVGDDAMGWFCHGIEERVGRAATRENALAALREVTRWRSVLGALLEDSEGALRMLRSRRAHPRRMK